MGPESVSPDRGHSFKCPLFAGASVSSEDMRFHRFIKHKSENCILYRIIKMSIKIYETT